MVCDSHFVSDPLFQHTWSCLHHYNYSEATFTAERIFAENPSDEAIYLLATCFYRSNGPKQAIKFILRQNCRTPKCRYLLAKCYIDIGNYPEAENTLLGMSQEFENPSDIVDFYKEIAPFVLRMLADILKQSERRKLAVSCLKTCLELNPLFWTAYSELIDLHDNAEPAEVFTLPKGVILNNQSCLRALSNKINIGDLSHPNCPSKKNCDIHDSQEDLSVSRENVNPKCEEKSLESVNSGELHFTEEQISYSFNGSAPHVNMSLSEHLLPNVQTTVPSRQKTSRPKPFQKDIEDISSTPIKPLFGNVCLAPSQTMYGFVPIFNLKGSDAIENVRTHQSPMVQKKSRNNKRVSFGEPESRKCSTPLYNTKSEKSNFYDHSTPSAHAIFRHDFLNYSAIPQVHESPLINEKSKILDISPMIRADDTTYSFNSIDHTPFTPRTRLQRSKAAAAQKSGCKKENASETCCGNKMPNETDNRLQSAHNYLQLLISMGRAYKFVKYYKLFDAITQIKQLPTHHAETALVSSWLATAYVDLNDTKQSFAILMASFQNEPWQLHGVCLYSSILWKLNKEREMISLSNEMMDMDRESAEFWCVLGNCLSLSKENEMAIRYFQRVIQIKPNYAYGYLLLGHEYFYQNELDKALTSYRRALDLDCHNINTSYCISSIFQHQENFIDAERILKEALKLFPESYVLLTHLGMIRSKLKQHYSADAVLELLERACRLYPNEHSSRFQKAIVLHQNGRHKDALVDLKLIESIKNARVYLLMSSVYRQMGDMVKAMVYKTWAVELDPKYINDKFMLDPAFSSGSNGNLTTVVSLGYGLRNSDSMHEDEDSTNRSNYQ